MGADDVHNTGLVRQSLNTLLATLIVPARFEDEVCWVSTPGEVAEVRELCTCLPSIPVHSCQDTTSNGQHDRGLLDSGRGELAAITSGGCRFLDAGVGRCRLLEAGGRTCPLLDAGSRGCRVPT